MKRTTLIDEQMALGEREIPDADSIRSRIAAIHLSDAQILEDFPPERIREAVREKLAGGNASSKRVTFSFYSFGGLAAAACLALALTVAGTGFFGSRIFPADEQLAIRAKGESGSQLYVYKKAGDTAIRLEPMSSLYANDIVQIAYRAGTAQWGTIISVDGSGVVTQHFPAHGDNAAPLGQSGEVSLAWAYRLDNAPHFERFIFVTSSKPFSAGSFKTALSAAARSDSTGTFTLDRLLPPKTQAVDVVLLK